MFLLLMSILKNSYSLNVQMWPLIIISKDYYDLLEFCDSNVKFLRISWLESNFYPVNKIKNNKWTYDPNWEKPLRYNNLSLSAYALFMFLTNSNFIYSLQELRVNCYSKDDNFEADLTELITNFKKSSRKLINLQISIYYKYSIISILNLKSDLEHISYSSPYYQSYDMLYDKVTNSSIYDTLPYRQLDKFIYNLENEDKQYAKEINSILNELLAKTGIQKSCFNYLSIINKWYYSLTFNYFRNEVFDFSLSVYCLKLSTINKTNRWAKKTQK